MGIVKISEPMHEEVRKSSNVMSRSMNSQAEFWLKIGMLAERNPTLTFNEIIDAELKKVNITYQRSEKETQHGEEKDRVHE